MANETILASVTRGGRVESVHFGSAVICDPAGAVIQAWGSPADCTYMRSSAKPIQAVTCLVHAGIDRLGWSDEELTIVCSSHSASTEHQQVVEKLLARVGLSAEDLQCGPHWPIDDAEQRQLTLASRPAGRLHNNCSGKHAGMLACCRSMGWSIATYLEPFHPLQQGNRETLGRFAGLEPSAIATATDGCGVPTFFASLTAMATAFARLASGEQLDKQDRDASRPIIRAIAAHPRLIAGAGRWNSQLAEFLGPRAVSKSGAEGVFCIGIADPAIGIAVKLSDGSARAHPAIVSRLVERYLPTLAWNDFRERTLPIVHNTLGEIVGQIESAI